MWEKHVKACQAAGIEVPSATSPGAPGSNGGGAAASSSFANGSEAASAQAGGGLPPSPASTPAPAPTGAQTAHGSDGASYDPAIHYPLLLTLKKKKKAVAPPSWAKAGAHGSMCFCCKGKKMNPAFF